jgi:uncharacterized protein (TIGR00369 family)
MRLEPNPANTCFGCGGANARGMKLAFEQDDAARCIRGRFCMDEEYSGAPGILHGGIIAVLLDEAMGKVNRFRGVRAVTAEMKIEYLRPIPVGQEIVIKAREVEMTGRNLFHEGEIRSAQGELLARGRGRFVNIGAPK